MSPARVKVADLGEARNLGKNHQRGGNKQPKRKNANREREVLGYGGIELKKRGTLEKENSVNNVVKR